MRIFFTFFITCCVCAGQSVTVGAIGGGRATDDVTSSAVPESRFYVVGAQIEVGLPHGFAVEFDGLYHRNRYIWGAGSFAGTVTQLQRGNDWQFPMLAKYYLRVPIVKPFGLAGIAPRTVSGTIHEYGDTINLSTGAATPFTGTLPAGWTSSLGIVVGGGMRFSIGHLQLSPQVRYTRWTSTSINTNQYNDQGFQSAQNQVDVLVGIGWKFR